ncbi:MAG: hypothetical protein IPM54_34845 [Polyangiaceae bacterium]|nr:hypothetical protein [Polyangiaceae bacterium]
MARIHAWALTFLRDDLGFADKLFAIVFVLLLVVYLYPIFAFKYLPMQDMPAHLAIVRIWSEIGTDSVLGQTYAARETHSPYIVTYGLLRLLSHVVSLHDAGKIVLFGYAASLPLSVAYTLRGFGRDPRLSLLAFAFIFNRQFVLGFFSSLVSIPLVIFGIGLLKRYLDAPSLRREATLAAFVVLLYFTHGLAALCFAIAAPIVFFSHEWRPLRILRRSLFVLPSLAIFLLWARRSSSGKPFAAHFSSVTANMVELVNWSINVLRGDTDEYVLVAVVATILLCAAFVARRPIRVRRSFSMAAAGIGLLTAFFLLPSHISQPIDHWGTGGRVVIPGLLLLLGLPSIDLRGIRIALLIPALTVMLAGHAKLGKAMADFDRQARHLDTVIAAMPADKRVMCLVYQKEHPAFEASPFWHFLTYYQVQKGGATSDGLVNESTPVKWRGAPLPSLFPHVASTAFKYADVGSSFDLFLVLWPEKTEPSSSFPGARHNVRLLAKSGRFAVYENVGRH